jgi:hypothetical protein
VQTRGFLELLDPFSSSDGPAHTAAAWETSLQGQEALYGTRIGQSTEHWERGTAQGQAQGGFRALPSGRNEHNDSGPYSVLSPE